MRDEGSLHVVWLLHDHIRQERHASVPCGLQHTILIRLYYFLNAGRMADEIESMVRDSMIIATCWWRLAPEPFSR